MGSRMREDKGSGMMRKTEDGRTTRVAPTVVCRLGGEDGSPHSRGQGEWNDEENARRTTTRVAPTVVCRLGGENGSPHSRGQGEWNDEENARRATTRVAPTVVCRLGDEDGFPHARGQGEGGEEILRCVQNDMWVGRIMAGGGVYGRGGGW